MGAPLPSAHRLVRPLPLMAVYGLIGANNGILTPFLPVYLRGLKFTATEVGVLLALGPSLLLVAPPVWGYFADKTGRADHVLRLCYFGAAAAFAPLLFARSYGAVLICLAVYALFYCTLNPLADSLALRRAAATGENFGSFRLFASLGYLLTAMAFGLLVSDRRAAISIPLATLSTGFLLSLTLRANSAPSAGHRWQDGVGLLRDPEVAALLAGASLHWMACAPYHGSLSIHVEALGLPLWVSGLAVGLGTLFEVAVMRYFPRLTRRIAARGWMLLGVGLSALRWGLMALVSSPAWIIGSSVLHAFTFGAFFMGAVACLVKRVPSRVRASGQALFFSIVFGLGGLVGFPIAGLVYDRYGGHRLFGVAAVLELLAVAVLSRVRAAREPALSRAPVA